MCSYMLGSWMASVLIQTSTFALSFQNNSLHALRLLCGALHAAMATLLHREQEKAAATGDRAKFVAGGSRFVVKDSAVFNAIIVACFQHVPPSLFHWFPQSSSLPGAKASLPSCQKSWGRVRRTVKQYLFDVVQLAETLQDVDMQSAVLKHIHAIAIFFVCFPKLLKVLNKCLIEKWSTADSHVQVLAFLAMRRLVLCQSHPALHVLLKVQLPHIVCTLQHCILCAESIHGICSQLQVQHFCYTAWDKVHDKFFGGAVSHGPAHILPAWLCLYPTAGWALAHGYDFRQEGCTAS